MLVHGFLDLAHGWREVGDRLAARAHVVAVDLRGHGDSDWIGPGGYYQRWASQFPPTIQATADDALWATVRFRDGAVAQWTYNAAGRGLNQVPAQALTRYAQPAALEALIIVLRKLVVSRGSYEVQPFPGA